jgi:hypothetical protein
MTSACVSNSVEEGKKHVKKAEIHHRLAQYEKSYVDQLVQSNRIILLCELTLQF